MVILTEIVITISACYTNAKSDNVDANCNKAFNAKSDKCLTQNVITFQTHNVKTQIVVIQGCMKGRA